MILMIFGFLVFAIVLWNKMPALEKKVVFLQNRVGMDAHDHREAVEQQDRENSMVADYVEMLKIHQCKCWNGKAYTTLRR